MTKVCSRCKEEKDVKCFARHPRMKSKLASYCTPCQSKNAKNWLERQTIERRAEIYRNKNLRKDYGITAEMYDAIFLAQNGVCAICKQHNLSRRLAVDHIHGTTTIRGLLCCLCNTALERLESDPDWGNKALSYLSNTVVESLLKEGEKPSR